MGTEVPNEPQSRGALQYLKTKSNVDLILETLGLLSYVDAVEHLSRDALCQVLVGDPEHLDRCR